MLKTRLLFLVILIEGYVVLASELLAIRQLIPFVGSGTETISIIISAVLLPLAIGYHHGGRKALSTTSIRRTLSRNLLWALCTLGLGLSYIIQELFFTGLAKIGIEHRLPQTLLYSLLFLVYPVYLLGQTVPLVSRYFTRRHLSEITGRMLFYSTTGSFLGSILSTLVLMNIVGVHYTVIVTMGMLSVLLMLLSRKLFSQQSIMAVLLFGMVFAFNGSHAMKTLNIVSNNAYNMVVVRPLPKEPEGKLMLLNRSISSAIGMPPEKRFHYIKYLEDNFIKKVKGSPKEILVIGAGGFTLGHDDTYNQYTFVDIDPALKEVSEEHFLPRKLGDNKRFVAASARAFLNGHEDRYDLILLDAYSNTHALPMETTTKEFLEAVARVLKPDGIVVSNVISSATFADTFTRRYHNTFLSVFPYSTRQVLGEFDPWNDAKRKYGVENVLYIHYNTSEAEDHTVYTDDLNTYSLDR